MLSEQELESDLRRQGINPANLSGADRKSAKATRRRELAASQPVTFDDKPAAIKVRAIPPAQPRLPPPNTPAPHLRQHLKETRAEYKRAIDKVAEGRFLLDQATERSKTAQGYLDSFSDLDSRLAAHAVDQLRAAKEDDSIPYHLQCAARDRNKARDRADVAEGARRQVQLELADA